MNTPNRAFRQYWTCFFVCLVLLLTGCAEREIRVHFEQAETYRQQGNIDKAIEEYQAILALDPNANDARNNLGLLYKEKGRFAEAIAEYREALSVKPDFVEAHYNLGVAYSAWGFPDSAEAAYKRAIQHDGDHVEAYNNLGVVYAIKSRYKEALEMYRKAIQIKPEYADTYNNLGILYSYQGWFEQAIRQYEKAIQHKPEFVDALNNLGSAYAELEQYEKAISYFDRALRLNPQHELARTNRNQAGQLLGETRTRRAAGEMRASHILVKTEAEARDLLQKLQDGASFEALARMHSIDPSAQYDGDLGGFMPGTLMPAFEQAVQNTKPGKIGGPFQTPAGYHIIKRMY